MDISIIIVNYKSSQKALACLGSIFNSESGDFKTEVIVVDNNSQDDIEQLIFAKYPQVNFIKSKINLGMGQGNNLGMENALGKYFLCLNADTVLKSDTIKKMYEYLKANEDVGLLAPRLLNPDGTLQYSCFEEYTFLMPLYRRTFLGKIRKKAVDKFMMKYYDYNEARAVDWIMGSCFMFKKELVEKIGAFDQRFFMYFEDTDFCRRVRKAGLKVLYYPEAEIIHDHGRGSARNSWYVDLFNNKLTREHIKSAFKYFWKWK